MVLDLLVLEEERRKGRLTKDQVSDEYLFSNNNPNPLDNNPILIEKFNEGFLLFDPISHENNMPEGYSLYYGYTFDKEAAYFINPINLLKAEGSREWVEVSKHAKARERDGMEILRIRNRASKKEMERSLEMNLSKDVWQVIRHSNRARFSRKAWQTIRQYAVPVKRAERVRKLKDSIDGYWQKAADDIVAHLKLGAIIIPNIEINHGMGASINFKRDRIKLSSLEPRLVYRTLGHYLHGRHAAIAGHRIEDVMGSRSSKNRMERLFKIAIWEAVGFYCAKFGNEGYNTKAAIFSEYGSRNKREEARRNRNIEFFEGIMEKDLDWDAAHDLWKGKLKDDFFAKLRKHIKGERNLQTLGKHLGAVFGCWLWDNSARLFVKQLMTTMESRAPKAFFSSKGFVGGIIKMQEEMKEADKKGKSPKIKL